MALSVGSKIKLQSFKHDQSLHRIWEKVTVLEESEEYIIVANRRTKVIEANGRFWYTKEPSVSFFFKNHWYNVIGIIKPAGVSFYCNLSSPILYDDEALKYIDYDLDIKVLPDFSYTVLDRNEYRRHQRQMKYPEKICQILEAELLDLKQKIEKMDVPFRHDLVYLHYEEYKKMGES